LGIRVFFQLDPDIGNKFTDIWVDLMGVGSRNPRAISIPLGVSTLVSMKPFEEPFLRSSHFFINGDRVFPLQVLFDGHPSQGFFFHRFTSWVGLIRDIIKQFQPQGNRCIDTKTDINGNLCSDTSGLPMY